MFQNKPGAYKSVPKITDLDGKTLKAGTDYEIVEGSYKNNLKKGTASVTIRGTGNYGGTKVVKFTIKSKTFKWWKFWE